MPCPTAERSWGNCRGRLAVKPLEAWLPVLTWLTALILLIPLMALPEERLWWERSGTGGEGISGSGERHTPGEGRAVWSCVQAGVSQRSLVSFARFLCRSFLCLDCISIPFVPQCLGLCISTSVSPSLGTLSRSLSRSFLCLDTISICVWVSASLYLHLWVSLRLCISCVPVCIPVCIPWPL